MTAASPSLRAAEVIAAVDVLVERRAVEQPGEAVVPRPMLVLGGVAAEAARCAGDDPEQHRPEHQQTGREE